MSPLDPKTSFEGAPCAPLPLYEYKPLTDDHIRVFQLDASENFSGIVSGTMRTVQLSLLRDFDSRLVTTTDENHAMARHDDPGPHQASTYNALSYAWGPTNANGSHLCHEIICDGARFHVTANLYQALQHIRELGS